MTREVAWGEPFVVPGRFKPYVRMTQRSKYVDEAAKTYLEHERVFREELMVQMTQKRLKILPGQTPFSLVVLVRHSRGFHNRDLDNEVKAIADFAQGVLYPDDRWMDEVYAARERSEQSVVGLLALSREPTDDEPVFFSDWMRIAAAIEALERAMEDRGREP